jgi:L-fuconolactonase
VIESPPTAETDEVVLEPSLQIIDPHHHFHDRSSLIASQPTPTGFIHPLSRLSRMRPRYVLEELLADVGSGHNVCATVFVECHAMYRLGVQEDLAPIGETEFANGIAAMSASGTFGECRVCAGIVGTANLTLGKSVQPILEAQIAAGNGRLKGIRFGAAWDEDESILGPAGRAKAGLLYNENFRAGLAQLAPLGLSYDVFLLEPQLGDAIDLAKSFPETTIVLNHTGGPVGVGRYAGKLTERFLLWKQRIHSLAQFDNVLMKIGGLGMHIPGFGHFLTEPRPTSRALANLWKPYVETCVEAFGPSRCMFESNFPVDFGSCSYTVLWNAFKLLAQQYDDAEKRSLFAATAAKTYRLSVSKKIASAGLVSA